MCVTSVRVMVEVESGGGWHNCHLQWWSGQRVVVVEVVVVEVVVVEVVVVEVVVVEVVVVEVSVLKSSCRTDERPATEPNRQWL